MYLCVWEKYRLQKLNSIVIIKINAEKWLCLYMILLRKRNIFPVTEVLLFILKLRENPSIQTFNNHSEQCRGQTEKEHSFLPGGNKQLSG